MIVGYPAAAVAAAEKPLLDRGEPLMERAAFALEARLRSLLRERAGDHLGPDPAARAVERRVVLLVGSGNNGGDALVAGARLARRGVRVTALAVGSRVHEPGAAALQAAGGSLVHVTDVAHGADVVAQADVVVDAILGIGAAAGDPALRGTAAALVRAVVAQQAARPEPSRAAVVAVDLPSGTGADDGAVPEPGAVLGADLTVTFGAVKAGLLLPPAAGRAGRLVRVQIGLDLDPGGLDDAPRAGVVHRLEPADLLREGLLRVPPSDGDKYARGVLGVVAGTDEFPGAGVLVTAGAQATGTGMVRYLGPSGAARLVLAAHPEVVTAEGRVQAWTVGSGMPAVALDDDEAADRVPGRLRPVGPREHARRAVAEACGSPGSGLAEAEVPVPCVVDAGALPLLPVRVPASVVLTPHAGELARLLRRRGHEVERRDVEAEPLRWARLAHQETGATVLLKGAVTVVVGPTRVYAQDDATPWLATAGAGDVLAGVLGALLATHAERVLAEPDGAALVAAGAALLHGRAARRASAGGPLVAGDVARAIPATCAAVLAGRDRA